MIMKRNLLYEGFVDSDLNTGVGKLENFFEKLRGVGSRGIG